MRMNDLKKKIETALGEVSPKQKALLICKGWREPDSRSLYGMEASLTEEEVEAIKRSLRTDQEKRTYNKWMSIYSTYQDILPTFGLGLAECERAGRKLWGYLNIWEAYEREEALLNSILQAVRETGDKEAEKTIIAEAEKTSKSLLRYARLKRDKDGFFEIDIFVESGLYELIQKAEKDLIRTYKGLKALITSIEKFTQRTHSRDFIPDILTQCTKEAKSEFTAFDLSKCYSRKELRLRKERGDKILEIDEKKAVFPEYDEIETVPEYVELFDNKIEAFEEDNR